VVLAPQRAPAARRHLPRRALRVAGRLPRRVLGELCDFLGEDFDEAMLEPAEVRDVVPERKTWHANLDSSVSTDRVEAWRERLDPWELGLAETVLSRQLSRWDYHRHGRRPPSRPGPPPAVRRRGARPARLVATALGTGGPRRAPGDLPGSPPSSRPGRWRRRAGVESFGSAEDLDVGLVR
jgi:hypothetical protein